MAKKVKCIECDNSMDWSIPDADDLKDNSFLKNTLKNTIVCSYTMKTKTVNHCQYCKHYEHESDFRQKCRAMYERKLEKAISEVEGE